MRRIPVDIPVVADAEDPCPETGSMPSIAGLLGQFVFRDCKLAFACALVNHYPQEIGATWDASK
ncbi:MAG: hypothetical protein F4103_02370 [Boseongicola sp. SB0673_bin_14]|nr:hypothetical protein [Boseongicola sp. SB0673_bin_14]